MVSYMNYHTINRQEPNFGKNIRRLVEDLKSKTEGIQRKLSNNRKKGKSRYVQTSNRADTGVY